jgi:cbb3-type cytochrome oxidase maturation protein
MGAFVPGPLCPEFKKIEEGSEMDEATIALTVMSGSIAAIFLGFFIWGLKTRQFRNVQEASRRMLQNNVQAKPENEAPRHIENSGQDKPGRGGKDNAV